MLEQGLASCGRPAGQIWPTACFCNKVLLEHSHTYWFTYCLRGFCAMLAELNSCNRDHMTCKIFP